MSDVVSDYMQVKKDDPTRTVKLLTQWGLTPTVGESPMQAAGGPCAPTRGGDVGVVV
jgi:hypothetical protein